MRVRGRGPSRALKPSPTPCTRPPPSPFPARRLGGTQLRDRLLEAGGFRVVSVPFYEWEALPSAAAKGEYLQRKVDAAASAAPAGAAARARARERGAAAARGGRGGRRG